MLDANEFMNSLESDPEVMAAYKLRGYDKQLESLRAKKASETMTEKCVFCPAEAHVTFVLVSQVECPVGDLVIYGETFMECSSGQCDNYFTGIQADERDRKVRAALRVMCEAMTVPALQEALAKFRFRGGMMYKIVEEELATRKDD